MIITQDTILTYKKNKHKQLYIEMIGAGGAGSCGYIGPDGIRYAGGGGSSGVRAIRQINIPHSFTINITVGEGSPFENGSDTIVKLSQGTTIVASGGMCAHGNTGGHTGCANPGEDGETACPSFPDPLGGDGGYGYGEGGKGGIVGEDGNFWGSGGGGSGVGETVAGKGCGGVVILWFI
jgi:hypothetical protein